MTAQERNRLIELGKAVGPAIKELITIVSPRTFARWLQEKKNGKAGTKIGRRPTPVDVQALVLQLARDNGWGYTLILGELKKLKITISRSTVVSILREAGLDPGPKRGKGTWSEFVQTHTQTLWACDFISKKIWTRTGLADCFLLFFIHLETRKVIASPVTLHPMDVWVVQQAKNFSMTSESQGLQAKYLIRDLDSKFTAHFDATLQAEGIELCKVGPRKPNLNAFAERFVQTIQSECLDHFIVFGENHFNHIVSEFVAFYNNERPHQGKDNQPLGNNRDPPAEGKIVCRERLGGLLKHYYRTAA